MATLDSMWRRLKNIFASLRAYSDLRPDLRMRQRVNRCLRNRPPLSANQWFEQFWQPQGINQPIVTFVYTQMQAYSGLEFARVRPHDRLNEDLYLTLVCWFDWETSFNEDFFARFDIDLGDRFDPQNFTTVEELVIFLNHQLLSVNHS
ncbi:MAG: hypothetical protein RBJ76_28785 [Stenomitos frigidus ULC029]